MPGSGRMFLQEKQLLLPEQVIHPRLGNTRPVFTALSLDEEERMLPVSAVVDPVISNVVRVFLPYVRSCLIEEMYISTAEYRCSQHVLVYYIHQEQEDNSTHLSPTILTTAVSFKHEPVGANET